MRYLITSIFCLLVLTGEVNAQTNNTANNRYSIQLPDLWKNKPRLLLKLTEFIQAKVPELKDKQECLDCTANNWVKFYISTPVVKNITHKTGTSEFVTLYHFTSFMDVYNKDNVLIKRIEFTNADDLLTYTTTVANVVPVAQNSINQIKTANAIAVQMSQPNYNTRNTAQDLARADDLKQAYSTNFDDYKYIKENREKLTPSNNTLWGEVENILLSIKLPTVN